MNPKLLFLALVFSTAATAQITRFPSNVDSDFAFSKSDTLQIVSLNTLGKLAEQDLPGAELPSGYRWLKDVRRTEAVKRTLLQNPLQDANGRDLPADAFKDAYSEASWRNRPKE